MLGPLSTHSCHDRFRPIADIAEPRHCAVMDFNLRDIEGDYSPLAQRLRWLALLGGIASGLLIVPIWYLAIGRCLSGCAPRIELALQFIMVGQLLLLISAISGIVAFRHPSWRLFGAALVPPVVSTFACIVTGVF